MMDCVRISPSDAHYFFAYYDKLQFSPENRWVLMQRAEFCDRKPRPDDVLRVGMIDRQADHAWIELGSTTAWCWQQGCMLQWLPGSQTEVIYNVRGESSYESVVVDVADGRQRQLPKAIYCVNATGTEAISLDFARIGHTRPGYGYDGFDDPNRHVSAPRDSGVWAMDLENGQCELLFSIADVAAIDPNSSMDGAIHWLNHALYNPSGSRFIVLHRWQNKTRRHTRMYTCNRDGSDLFQISDSSVPGSWHASHFWWQDDRTILMWGETYDEKGGVYLAVEDGATKPHQIFDRGLLTCDGHMSYPPNGRSDWFLSDNYPNRQTNQRELFLFDTKDNKRHVLGAFDAGPYNTYDPLTISLRCDLHPRWDREGSLITFDSVHEGYRGVYLMDVSSVLTPTPKQMQCSI